MAWLAVLRAVEGGGSEAWVRTEGVLGRRQGDSTFTVTVSTEKETVALGLRDATVGRRHARVYFRGDQLLVEDLGSKNGTFLDGREVRTPLVVRQSPAEVRLGPRTVLRVELVDAPLGLTGHQWGQLSVSLSHRDMTRVLGVWRWADELGRSLEGPMTSLQVKEWFERGHGFLEAFPDVEDALSDHVRRLDLHLLPDDALQEEEKAPLLALCKAFPERIQAHYLR